MPLITKDQFFELWFPTSYWAQQFGGVKDPNNRRNARESINGKRQFDAAWETYNRDQIAAENPRSVIDTPYTFNEPAPTFTKWGGPCYDQNCTSLRASIEATERANYASWQTRKAAAEAAEQKRLYEVALLQEADIKAQKFEAEEAAKFLISEQQRAQQELVLEQQKIAEQQKQEQTAIESQINAARLAAEQEQAAIQLQFETDKASAVQQQQLFQTQFEAEKAEAQKQQELFKSQFESEQAAAQKQQELIKSQFEIDISGIKEQQINLAKQFESEKAQNEMSMAQAATETAKQQLIGKKQTAIQQKAASATNLLRQPTQTANVNIPEEKQRRKSMIGQPGVSVTRVSARSGVGGYGGTAPTRVNPTGLNI